MRLGISWRGPYQKKMTRVLIDNWSLQETAQLLRCGIEEGHAHVIEIDRKLNRHLYKELPGAIPQLEAFFDLLGELVLRDQLLVDGEFTNVWDQDVPGLTSLKKEGIIHSYEFLADPERLAGPRDSLVKKLCVTPTLIDEHAENELGWRERREVRHGVLSSTLWGGAGMLARSHVYECPYSPHPLRRRLFESTGLIRSHSDSVRSLNAFVQDKRLAVFRRNNSSESKNFAFVKIPSIAVKIIELSESFEEIFRVAMQLRREMGDLRNWLGEFQGALDGEDNLRIIKCRDIYESVSRNVDRIIGAKNGGVDMSIGIGFLKFSLKDSPVSRVLNKFGVRATINSLIIEKEGRAALRKFLKMLGHRDSALGVEIIEHFESRSSEA